MATKRMLIDAAHPEETRVAIMDGNQLEEFDVESASRKQLKGNIYLAKVTRVEPSLQAAFVDYGGNRHGFLAFNEIHPDYYQIPVADRELLLEEENSAEEREEEAEEAERENESGAENAGGHRPVEIVGGDELDEVEDRRKRRHVRRYKIQEVIKRRQILLIQVVKEERGNKGAALTTYLSLAGRYCVLMPNTGKGGGISRKIGGGGDRKRLKSIISDLDIPKGMAVIVRTAGADRSKAEIKRDYEYLIKLWDNIRNLTLESTAPALIHEEASIIKRAIRDQYSREFEEVLIEGEEGYKSAKSLMKMLIPSHSKKVQPYKDPLVPLFSRYHIESKLETMNHQEVQLKSGGYIVLNATEALVAIDVNSGRATRGRNIEETALKTNLEAATEIARQLRLRDLAGLIVVDFIDMEYHRNQVAVERRMKEAMRRDRARIQIGRISPFGLLEMSRQRLRPSINETITDVCPHCGGSGILRSIESTSLHVLRAIEEEGSRKRAREIEVKIANDVALYILNYKREHLAEIETRFGLRVIVLEDSSLVPPNYVIDRTIPIEGASGEEEQAKGEQKSEDEEGGQKRKRRRRGRGRGRGEDGDSGEVQSAEADEAPESEEGKSEAADTEEKPKRRRGRRGGRRRKEETAAKEDSPAADTGAEDNSGEPANENPPQQEADAGKGKDAAEPDKQEKPKRRRSIRRKAKPEDASKDNGASDPDAGDDKAPAETAPSKPDAAVAETASGTETGSEPESDAGGVEGSGLGEPAEPPEQSEPGEPSAPSEPETRPEDAAAAANVTVVGSGGEEAPDKSGIQRRGWWQRSEA